MAATIESFKLRFPEFADDSECPDLRIDMYLNDAIILYLGTDEKRWNTSYNIAQEYLAAHLLAMAAKTEAGNTAANSGPITSKSAGGVSVTRAANSKERSDADDFLMQTAYGQQYIVIRNRTFVGVRVATY